MVLCAPDWQEDFFIADDSGQDRLYDFHRDLLNRKSPGRDRELAEFSRWLEGSGGEFYHIEKMHRTSDYICPKVPVMISVR